MFIVPGRRRRQAPLGATCSSLKPYPFTIDLPVCPPRANASLNRLENKLLLKWNLKLPQQRYVLRLERFIHMMLNLPFDISNHIRQMRMGIRKRSEPLLPRKPPNEPPVFINMIRRTRFDIPHQIRQRHIRFQSHQNVRVIRHAMNRDQFLAISRNNARDVFLQFLFSLRRNQTLSPFDSEHDLDVDLRIRVGHFSFFIGEATFQQA